MPQREGAKRRRERLGRAEAAAAESPPSDAAPVARGVWSGSISFGLVTVPVELYSAQRRSEPSLRMLTPDGVPLRRRYVCSADGKPLEPDEIARGYPLGDGEFVLVSDEELERLAPRRSRDIELSRFVPRDAVDPAWFVRSYFLVPGGEQTKAYRLLAEIMQATGRVAIASFVMRDKQYPVAIFADAGLLRAETLRFGDELRRPEDVDLAKPGKVDAAQVKKLAKAIDRLAAETLDESELEDDHAERLLALARAKRERGEDVVEAPAELRDDSPPAAEGADVIDLVALLKQRLGGRARPGAREMKKARPRRAEAAKEPRRKRARRRAR